MLNDFSIVINEGEIIFFTGLFGCGKEEIGHILSGEQTFHSGCIHYREKIYFPGEYFCESERAIILNQKNMIFPNLSVAENIYLDTGKRNIFSFVRKKKLYRQAQQLLEAFDLHIDLNLLGRELPVHDQLCICMLRSFLNGLKIVVIDNIFFHSMDLYTEQIKKTMDLLKHYGMTILLISGNISHVMEVNDLADRIVVMRDGRIVKIMDELNPPQEIFKYAILSDDSESTPQIIQKPSHKVIFEMINIQTKNIHGLTFSMYQAETVGIFDSEDYQITEELDDILFGKMIAVGGEMYLAGKIYRPTGEWYAIRHGVVSYRGSNDEQYFFDNLSVLENILIPVYKKTSIAGFINNRVKDGIIEDLKGSGLENILDRKMDNLGYYNSSLKNKVIQYRYLYMSAKLIVLVEPLLRCDQEIKRQILENVQFLKKHKFSILVLLSRIKDLEFLCDRVILLKKGNMSS